MKYAGVALSAALVLLTCHAATAADAPSAAHLEFFELEVRPLLARNCLECHGAQRQEAGLRLDSLAAMLTGGESGSAAVVPSRPDESLLVEAIRYESYEMPPDGQLSEREIGVLVKWIELGAPWPGDETTQIVRKDSDKITDEDRQWWAFQPLRQPQPPALEDDNWSRNDIDRFILARLREHELEPAGEADRATLIRRLYFDLVGLPPSPEEVAAFLADTSPTAYEALVERLLESPHYGERWARHWLDLVRYADSDGYRADHYRPNAWRYRDYVIRSFNEDKPYDQFVQEQIAGDELFPDDPQATVATGYLRHWIYEYNIRDARGQWTTILNDITDTTGDVFLGLGMRCAQCHDHKFDPILQKDYYRLQSFFAALLPRDDLVAMTDAERAEYDRELAAWEAETAELRAQIEELEAPYRQRAERGAVERFPDDIQAIYNKPAGQRTTLESQLAGLVYRQVLYDYDRLESRFPSEVKERALALRKQLSDHDRLKPEPLPIALAATDVSAQQPEVFVPGHSDEAIEPGFLAVLDEPAPTIEPLEHSTGRRAALARWMTRDDNPLTTRVMVNRIWQHHFGSGLAANASDFGKLGELPTHGDLLDWLAVRFVRGGWRMKDLHRLIVTSATYRQATEHPQLAAGMRIDPQNKLYWRADTRRLDAEQIRDAVLAACGELNLQAGGPGVDPETPRRTIYTRVMRNARDPLLDVFDLPQFFSSESSRNTTTTAVQSLLLINNPQMLRYASLLAQRASELAGSSGTGGAARSAGDDDAARIIAAWWLAYCRAPSDDELRAAQAFLAEQRARIAPTSDDVAIDVPTGKLPYRDGQAVVLDPEVSQRFRVPHHELLDGGDFTVEAYFQVRSIYDSGSVRTVVCKWNGSGSEPGWAFGVTGKGSRRKPQTLVLQMHGMRRGGKFGEAALFSDQHIEINRPYYAAASVHLADGKREGTVTFYLKDLSNDDEPLLVAELPHDIVGGLENREPLAIGARSNESQGFFDGLIDDVRITSGTREVGQLLFTSEGVTADTIGYWQFEVEPGVYRDSSPHELNMLPGGSTAVSADPAQAAFVDFCHALLNSNEFLYVH